MEPFLKQVAEHYFPREDFSGLTFIFPNRRSSAFFRRHVCGCAASASKAVLMPECLTINDFFASLVPLRTCGRITQIVRLYGCYKALHPEAEPLDDFVCWGDVLLGDFNDVDKYLVNPRQLFTNVSDLKSIEDDFRYLTPSQREAIHSFLSHFRAEPSSPEKDRSVEGHPGKDRSIKLNFLKIWNILLPLYNSFNKSLRSDGLAYEGMVYRAVVSPPEPEAGMSAEMSAGMPQGMEQGLPEEVLAALGDRKFVFVGLNALNECEKKLLRHLRNAGRAEFCWDWSGEWIKNPKNRASFFMSVNVREFPQAFTPDAETGLPETEFNLVSVPSSIGQTKQLPYILKRLGLSGGVPDTVSEIAGASSEITGASSETALASPAAGLATTAAKASASDTGAGLATECAIVLPDEGLLLPVLNSIPDDVRDINVTMGYPMKGSDLCVLMSALSAAQMNTLGRGGKTYFYHRHVRSVLSNNIFRKIASERDRAVCSAVLNGRRSYIDSSDFASSPLLSLCFTPLQVNPAEASSGAVCAFAEYHKSVLSRVGALLAECGHSELDTGFAKDFYKAVCLLGDMKLEIKPATYLRLLDQLLAPVSVPFNGEPLKGLQVMGPLEMRALDFRNLIILSCNEGTFPRRSFSSSFIPPELRKGFGLPTYEYQDSVWAYYFYRMIQRAENVWMLFDSRAEEMKTGEESRYVKQLDYLFGAKIHRYVTSPVQEDEYSEPEISKTPADLEKLRGFTFSATAFQDYLACPAKFYYARVLELGDLAESADNLDGGTLGTVFHAVMQWIYAKPGTGKEPVGRVDEAFIRRRLSKEFAPELRSRISKEICEAVKTVEVRGKDIVLCRVIEQYVRGTLEHDLSLMKSRGTDHFTVLALEKNLPFEFEGDGIGGGSPDGQTRSRRKYSFKGFIDRLDSFDDGTVRVVDYKTGKVTGDEARVMGEEGDDASKASAIFESIFAEDSKDRPKIALQFFIYNLMLRLNPEGRELVGGRRITNAVYSVSGIFKDGCFEYSLPQDVIDGASGMLKDCLDGIFDVERNPVFRRTGDADICEYCDFRMICGR